MIFIHGDLGWDQLQLMVLLLFSAVFYVNILQSLTILV